MPTQIFSLNMAKSHHNKPRKVDQEVTGTQHSDLIARKMYYFILFRPEFFAIHPKTGQMRFMNVAAVTIFNPRSSLNTEKLLL